MSNAHIHTAQPNNATMAANTVTSKFNIPLTKTSHPNDPIPEEPKQIRSLNVATAPLGQSPQSSDLSASYSEVSSDQSEPSTPGTDLLEDAEEIDGQKAMGVSSKRRRASTILISQNSDDVRRILGDGGTELVKKVCCGGGCCMMQPFKDQTTPFIRDPVQKPDNAAYRSLGLKLGPLGLESELSNIAELPAKNVNFGPIDATSSVPSSDHSKHPPQFVKPHPPYEVYAAPVYHARELTRAGAEKRTYHFDIDVSQYPIEGGDVDFVVGGAIGVCPANSPEAVDEIFDLLGVPKFVRDKKITLRTGGGRWPTIWGEEEPRELVTTRRELLTWCSDIQSYPPTKQLLRLLAEYASSEHEKKILMYLASAQGQASFCDLRTGPFLSLAQILAAFPSARPPLDHILSILNQLMPRFYSLSQDPQISCWTDGSHCRKLVEIAVTVHDAPDWVKGSRTGVGSGFLERIARQIIDAEKAGIDPKSLNLKIPMFRGLMANPLAREFISDGPMLLIGAGVGVAPFRGFVQRRLKSANCANKVWVLQGVRDSLLDELYSGEWGVEEEQVKKVVQSRRGEGRYVQEEVRHQADLVWFIINALDGRVFVCGSSKGMGEGVERALTDVAKAKGGLNEDEAKAFWEDKKSCGQYIAETW